MKNKTYSKIKYFDLYGLRKEKGDFLESHSVKNTKWRELELKEPNFWFVPKDMRGERLYKKFISVKDIFEKYSSGIKTHRDEFIVAQTKDELITRLNIFVDRMNPDDYVDAIFKFKKHSGWNTIEARKQLIKEGIQDELVQNYNYRIFDNRWIYFSSVLITRLREDFMKNLLRNNLSLVTTRILSGESFQHVFISDKVGDICFISNKGKESNYYFPLYLYDTSTYAPKKEETKSSYKNLMLFDKPKEKESNIKTEIIEKLSKAYKKKITPEEIFYYIYAVLYSSAYRKKYNEFLKIDFPKIPFTDDIKLFNKVSKLGKELADLHLLKSKKLENNKSVKFPAVGDNKAEKREYKDNKIYINDKQYFTGITPEVWNYHIGGYQVLDKWLKDRKDKDLSREEVDHYLKIITALKLTIKFQKEIDELYGEIEKSLIFCKK